MSWITPDLIEILLSILKAVVILLVVVTCGAFMSFGERRLLGLFQNRYGPNRVGWGGSLQLVADMMTGGQLVWRAFWTKDAAKASDLGTFEIVDGKGLSYNTNLTVRKRWLMSVKCWANLIKLRINN